MDSRNRLFKIDRVERAGLFLPFSFCAPEASLSKIAKSNSIFDRAMDDGITEVGGLGYSAIHNQEMKRSDSDSEAGDRALRSERSGPRIDEHGKR